DGLSNALLSYGFKSIMGPPLGLTADWDFRFKDGRLLRFPSLMYFNLPLIADEKKANSIPELTTELARIYRHERQHFCDSVMPAQVIQAEKDQVDKLYKETGFKIAATMFVLGGGAVLGSNRISRRRFLGLAGRVGVGLGIASVVGMPLLGKSISSSKDKPSIDWLEKRAKKEELIPPQELQETIKLFQISQAV
ncbi:MAG: hypothetical protein NUV73_02945, partial [Candidatus Daviesbacteria bacterium]|nr:hypothetical protein [Candidatus Daviesbacteria bacterium]